MQRNAVLLTSAILSHAPSYVELSNCWHELSLQVFNYLHEQFY